MNDVVLDGEKTLWADEARPRKFSTLEIAAIERNRETIEMRPARDLAEN